MTETEIDWEKIEPFGDYVLIRRCYEPDADDGDDRYGGIFIPEASKITPTHRWCTIEKCGPKCSQEMKNAIGCFTYGPGTGGRGGKPAMPPADGHYQMDEFNWLTRERNLDFWWDGKG